MMSVRVATLIGFLLSANVFPSSAFIETDFSFGRKVPAASAYKRVVRCEATKEVNTGKITVSRHLGGVEDDFMLSYRVFRPMSLSSRQAAPIVVIHGGPSLPSDYLEDLVNVIPYRSIVLYDQLGCGDSDEPKSLEA
jgi:pimeloyl-ACP methyl ester carboxylesterase